MSVAPARHAPRDEPGDPAGRSRSRESVAVVLVSHDGAAWLPTVLDGLAAQLAPVQRVVAVDTGSRDGSADLLRAALGADAVLEVPSATSFPVAVRAALAHLDAHPDSRPDPDPGPEWIWLLHDDASPHPEALLALLAGAAEDPDADVLGPMLREWPSLRRLLELGVTISGTGRRETGLERGEYDQGQYSEVRPVLAVNTAGMLVRRSVLDGVGGFDEELPMFGNDLDFGWRAAAAGHRTVVVPQAVVFHAEAAHRGLRRTPLTGRHTHYQERRSAVFTLLANSPSRWWPLLWVRLGLGTLVRMLGLTLVRAPGQALDELAAFVAVSRRPGQLRAARRSRHDAAREPEAARALLAPWWLPYRHGLDAILDLGSALGRQASDVAERRRIAAAAADPSSFAARRTERLEEEDLVVDTGVVARLLTNPVAVLLTLAVLALLVSVRDALGHVSGPGLSPAPDHLSGLWSLWLSSSHDLGLGTVVPAPPYVLPLALLATVLGGSPVWAVSLLLVASVPLSVWGAWRFLRVAGRLATPAGASRWLILWGAVTYALVPVVAGLWGQGRIGPVLAAVTLPWLAHAALGFADPEPDRRWRAGWRSGLLLTLVVAGTPVAWLLGVVVGLVVVVLAFTLLPGLARDRSSWGPPLAALAVAPVVLAPWWVTSLLHGAGAGLLLDGGALPLAGPERLDLVLGRVHDLGAPWWLGLVVPVLALVALVPRRTRIPVLLCWTVALLGVLTAVALAAVRLHLTALTTSPGLAFPLVLVQGALVTAAVLGALGVPAADPDPSAAATSSGAASVASSWSSSRPGTRRVAGTVLGLVAVVAPLGGLAWSVATAGGGDLTRDQDTDIPAYMVQSSTEGPAHGILVVRGSVDDGLTYTIRRGDGVTTGEDEMLALTAEDPAFTRTLRTLAGRPTPAAVDALAGDGIQYVVLPAPADPEVAASLDATAGLEQASAEDRSTRAWQVDRTLADAPAPAEASTRWLHVALLVVGAAALVVVLVLCAPSAERRRS